MRATIYNASAGSGKTYKLAYKYVRDVIEEPMLYRHILAVTFTNKATEEMKSRILGEIHLLASGAKSNYMEELLRELPMLRESDIRVRAAKVRGYILHDYSHFTILTIDTFFQRIIRAFIHELNIDLNYNVEIETSSVLTKSADKLIEHITVDKELKEWLMEFIEERIEEGKRWDIRDGILSLGNEIFKESNRQTFEQATSKEKLKEIMNTQWKECDATKKQMQALGERAMQIITAEGCTTSDFSGKSRSFAAYFNIIANGEIKAPTATALKKASSTDGWTTKGSPAAKLVGELQPILSDICDCYFENIKKWNTTTLLRENYRSFALLSDLYNTVKQVCDEQNMMLLSETKLILSTFIANNDAPFIYEKSGNRYDRYMIDEFQDTSLKEWHNFLPLLENAMAQADEDQSSVLIVGDIKQSIYRWRGGDWRILHSLAKLDLGEEETEVINLKENYRSLPMIVEFNNAVIRNVVTHDNDTLNARLDDARGEGKIDLDNYNELNNMLINAYTDHEQNPRKSGDSNGYIEVTPCGDDEPAVVERIKEIIDLGFKPNEILILTRSKSEGVKIADMLLQFKRINDNPKYYFDVMTQEALIVGSAPISSFIIAVLTLAIDERNGIQRVIFNQFFNDRALDAPISEEDLLFLRTIRLLSPEEAFEQIVIHYDLTSQSAHVAYLQAIHEQIIAFCNSKIGDTPLFLKWWNESGKNKSLSVEQSENSIEITTIHKAKGLEKAVVILPYCNWALDPKSSGTISNIVWTDQQSELEELGSFPVKFKKAMGESLFSNEYYREQVYSHVDNINLLYVALTRASQALYIFVPTRSASVGDLLLKIIDASDETPKIGSLQGTTVNREFDVSYAFGERAKPLTRKQGLHNDTSYIMSNYPTAASDLRLKLPSQRYFEESANASLSPRQMGILMHKAFEEARSTTDIFNRIDKMCINGLISSAEQQELTDKMKHALSIPPIGEWFSTQWDEVRNEHDIILPKDATFKRPDRVMTLNDRAVVVDYKFGFKESEAHKAQVREYMDLLLEMGYNIVEGYLWYIKIGHVVEVK